MHYPSKINLNGALDIVANVSAFKTHRSGWLFALNSLKKLHTDKGIILDGTIENTFSWNQLRNDDTKIMNGYNQSWVGFVHYPPSFPEWCNPKETLPYVLKTDMWKKSMNYCKGLFSLSNYSKEWLEEYVDVPIVSLFHPTETPAVNFSMKSFLSNQDKSIVVVGNLLRKLYSIYQLRVTKLRKVLLTTNAKYVYLRLARELQYYKLIIDYKTVEMKSYLANSEYDEYLSKNIVFLDLYDSSANNTIIECIVRNTPLLINSLPAVREYLGKDYPFYFKSLDEAAEKAENFDLIQDTHNYLMSHPIKKKLTADYFLESFAESTIYRKLPSII